MHVVVYGVSRVRRAESETKFEFSWHIKMYLYSLAALTTARKEVAARMAKEAYEKQKKRVAQVSATSEQAAADTMVGPLPDKPLRPPEFWRRWMWRRCRVAGRGRSTKRRLLTFSRPRSCLTCSWRIKSRRPRTRPPRHRTGRLRRHHSGKRPSSPDPRPLLCGGFCC
jgi:hypothetical protein